MKTTSLLLLRASVGLLVLLWGIDKIVNVEHALRVSDGFYFGLFSNTAMLQAWGVVQTAIGALALVGLARRWVLPAIVVINGATLLGVWRSILDPWGWYLEGTNVLFFPSLIIFAASLLIWAFRDEDLYALDRRLAKSAAVPGATAPHPQGTAP